MWRNTHRQWDTWHGAFDLIYWHVTEVSPSSFFTHKSCSTICLLGCQIANNSRASSSTCSPLTRCSQFLWLFPSLLTTSNKGTLSLYISGPMQQDNDKGCPYHLFNKALIYLMAADKRHQTSSKLCINHKYTAVKSRTDQFAKSQNSFFSISKLFIQRFCPVFNY